MQMSVSKLWEIVGSEDLRAAVHRGAEWEMTEQHQLFCELLEETEYIFFLNQVEGLALYRS